MFQMQALNHPSNALNRFAMLPGLTIGRSKFSINHFHKLTLNAGYIVPIDLLEVLPGDTWNYQATVYARLTSQLVPLMDNLWVDTFAFFVPNRLVWTHWINFMGERSSTPSSSIDYTVPVQTTSDSGDWAVGNLADCYGIPVGVRNVVSVNALPFRGYNFIYNEYFLDQNIQNRVTLDTGDGPDDPAVYVLRQRGKRHDYFTSCLPSPQKGTAVSLPLGTAAPVLGIGKLDQTFDAGPTTFYESDGTTSSFANYSQINDSASKNKYYVEKGGVRFGTAGYPGIYADLSSATAATINALRSAFQIQVLLERDARGGTRYPELLHSQYGVIDPAMAVLQRPVFLGGASVPFMQQGVPQTTYQGTATFKDAKGALSANSVAIAHGTNFVQSMTEHGYIHILASIRSQLTYQQGIDKHWLRSTRYDFYIPALAHIGEQAVTANEIWLSNSSVNDATVFGYQERGAEYRWFKSIISGPLRSDYATSLDYFHLAQDFASQPTLSSTFIVENPPISRVTQVTVAEATPSFFMDVYVSGSVARAMPVYGVPASLGGRL